MGLSYFLPGGILREMSVIVNRAWAIWMLAGLSYKIKNRPGCAWAVLCGRDKNLETELQIQFCTGARRRKTNIGVVILICQILYR